MLSVQSGNELKILSAYRDLEIIEELSGNLQLSLTSMNIPSNEAHMMLRKECIIEVDDHEFIVKQVKAGVKSTDIVAFSTFFELGSVYKYDIFGGTKSFDEFMTYTLNGTGWTFTNKDVTGFYLIANFGEENVLNLIKSLCSIFGCYYKIMPGKHIMFAKEMVSDSDSQYRYKANIQSIMENADYTQLKTRIVGYGANGLMVTYTSPTASIFGVREAPPIENFDIFGEEEMGLYLKGQIQDMPMFNVELETLELVSKQLGEKVWLIHEVLDLEFQSLVLITRKRIRNGVLKVTSVVLGDRLPTNQFDLFTGIKQNIDSSRREYRSKIEQTNDRITLEVEEIGKSLSRIELKADQIELSVNNRITQEVAAINIRADQIELSVNNRITNEMAAINLRADNIQLQVNNNDQEIAQIDIKANQIQSQVTNNYNQTQSQITQLSGQINLKVDKGGVISEINLEPGAATIDADKINLNGAVMANGSITGSSTINVGTDLYVGNNIYLAQGSNDTKTIIFDNVARITGNWYEIRVSGPSVVLESSVKINGTLDLSNANVVGWTP